MVVVDFLTGHILGIVVGILLLEYYRRRQAAKG